MNQCWDGRGRGEKSSRRERKDNGEGTNPMASMTTDRSTAMEEIEDRPTESSGREEEEEEGRDIVDVENVIARDGEDQRFDRQPFGTFRCPISDGCVESIGRKEEIGDDVHEDQRDEHSNEMSISTFHPFRGGEGRTETTMQTTQIANRQDDEEGHRENGKDAHDQKEIDAKGQDVGRDVDASVPFDGVPNRHVNGDQRPKERNDDDRPSHLSRMAERTKEGTRRGEKETVETRHGDVSPNDHQENVTKIETKFAKDDRIVLRIGVIDDVETGANAIEKNNDIEETRSREEKSNGIRT